MNMSMSAEEYHAILEIVSKQLAEHVRLVGAIRDAMGLEGGDDVVAHAQYLTDQVDHLGQQVDSFLAAEGV